MAPSKKNSSAGSSGGKRNYPRGGPSAADKKRLRDVLLGLRAALMRSNQDLANEALKGSGQDFSIDHLADHASDNTEQMISIALLEGETKLLESIEDAIHKIDGNHELAFGMCEDCAEKDRWDPATTAPWIPAGRLDVVPYARLCVRHQERAEAE